MTQETMSPQMRDALAGLPHGPGFRFVDGISELLPGREATGFYQIRGDEAFLAGHFPDRPIWPGVILIEMIAQLGGILAQCDPAAAKLTDLRLAAVRAARIHGAAVPGQRLEIRARIEGRIDGLVQIEGEVRIGEMPLASARVTLSGTVK